MKNLIVYFSRAGENYVNGRIVNLPIGNTEQVAHMLNNQIESDLFKVETIHQYSSDYTKCTEEALIEKQEQRRPKISDYVHQFHQYENIFLLYPNWWSTMPMPMFTFLEQHDTTEKNIIPLCTHEGSGMKESLKDIKQLCPYAHILTSLSLRGSEVKQCENKLDLWLKELNL